MVSTEQTRDTVHQFRAEVDDLYLDHLDADKLVKETLESVVNAVIRAIEAHPPIVDLDLQNRQRLWRSEISDEEYGSLEMVVNYLAANWLVGSKSVLQLVDRYEILLGDERVEQLRGLVVGMDANLRALDETERTMGKSAMAMEQSALEEHRRGETEPFF